MPVLDTDFRNGIGHHAAHYEQEHDAVVIFDTKDAGKISRVVGYTEFCERCLICLPPLNSRPYITTTFTFTSAGGLPDSLPLELVWLEEVCWPLPPAPYLDRNRLMSGIKRGRSCLVIQ